MKFYFLEGKERKGPFTLKELESKGLERTTLVWKEGAEKWEQAAAIPELAELMSRMPPPVPVIPSELPSPVNEQPSTPPTPVSAARTSAQPSAPVIAEKQAAAGSPSESDAIRPQAKTSKSGSGTIVKVVLVAGAIAAVGLLLLLGFCLIGGLMSQKAKIRSQIAANEQDKASLGAQLDGLRAEVLTLESQKSDKEKRRDSLKDELASYCLNHKMATAAALAAGGGVAAVLSDDMDKDTKDVLKVLGALGAIYCLANAEECADVVSRIGYYGSEIDQAKEEAEALQTRIGEKEQEISGLESQIESLDQEIQSLREKL